MKLASEKGLVKGKTVAVDATTLEANAAMKSIIRRDSGEDFQRHTRLTFFNSPTSPTSSTSSTSSTINSGVYWWVVRSDTMPPVPSEACELACLLSQVQCTLTSWGIVLVNLPTSRISKKHFGFTFVFARKGVVLGLMLAGMFGSTSATMAIDFGAVTDGDWNDASTWTPAGGTPGAADDAFIGSNSPAGSAASATVILTADQDATFVAVGNGAGTNGTLNLDSFTLTLSGQLVLGDFGGTGNLLRTTGNFESADLRVDNASVLNFVADDIVSDLMDVEGGAQVTTAAAGNVTNRITVRETGSLLTLGAPLTLSSNLTIRQDGTVDLNGQDLSVSNLTLGFIGTGGTLVNSGAITVTNDFAIEQSTFVFDANDSITDLTIAASTVTLDSATQVRDLSLSQGSTFSTINASSVNRSR